MSVFKDLYEQELVDQFEIISQEEYDKLDEGAQRTYRRVNNNITQYYRCTSGPKKGKLASDPSKCGQRKDPAKVRNGRKVAQTKGAIRVRKTLARKRTQASKRVTALNFSLSQRRNGSPTRTTESLLDRMNAELMLEGLDFSDDQFDALIASVDQLIEYVEQLDETNTAELTLSIDEEGVASLVESE